MAEKKVEPKVKGIAQADKTVLKSTALGGMHGGGAPVFVDVKDGKIVRVRPFHYDWKYDMKSFNPWKFERNGVKLEPLTKTCIGPYLAGLQEEDLFPQPHQVSLKES